MLLDTSALGQINYEEEDIISFSSGLPGFENLHKYLLIQPDPEAPIAYLQSMDDSRLHFVVINPFSVHREYEFDLDDADQYELEIDSKEDVEVWTMVTTGEHIQETTINLLAPIIINSKRKRGKQVILHHSVYRTKHKLADMIGTLSREGE